MTNEKIARINELARKSKTTGLTEAEKVLAHVPGIGMVHFTDADVVRHDMVGRIIRAYESFYKKE